MSKSITTLWVGAALALAASGALAQAPYPSGEAAADALIDAVDKRDAILMYRVLGPEWRRLMPTEGVPAADRQLFLQKAREARRVEASGNRAELQLGPDRWVLPIALVQKNGQWSFDPSGGRNALVAMRIDTNERSAREAAMAYVAAQHQYAKADRNGDGELEYAQKLASSPKQRDGLIWSPTLGDASPLGEAYLPARAGQGYHGYRFRILDAQGAAADGGAKSYRNGKRLQNGFALIAWPTTYGQTGVATYLVNQEGRIYQRDLGPQTAGAAAAIKSFDPGTGWAAVKR